MISLKDLQNAKQLKFLREQTGTKQEVLARAFGYNDNSLISKLENGKQVFTKEIIKKICCYFKVSMSQFHKISTNKLKPEPSKKDLKKDLKKKLNNIEEKKLATEIKFENLELKISLEKTKAQMQSLYQVNCKNINKTN